MRVSTKLVVINPFRLRSFIKRLTIVLAELNTEPEHLLRSFSWHFLCTAVWQAEGVSTDNDYISIGKEIKGNISLTNTLISLFAKSPNEQIAEGTKCRLPKEFRHKSMAVVVMSPKIKANKVLRCKVMLIR